MLRQTWLRILKGEQAVVMENLKAGLQQHRADEVVRRLQQENFARGQKMLRQTWLRMMKGEQAVLVDNWKDTMVEYRAELMQHRV